MTTRSGLGLVLLLLSGRAAYAECPPVHIAQAMPSLAAHAGCTREASRTPGFSAPMGTATAATPARSSAIDANRMEGNRWSLAGVLGAQKIASEHSQDAEFNTPVQQSLSGVHWADARDWIHNPPEWVLAAKNYKRQGMPLLHLMQSEDKSTLLSLGVSNHGKPGLFLTHKLPY